MEKRLFTFFALFSVMCFGQVETKWETLNNGSKGVTMYYRLVSDGDEKTFEAKYFIFKGLTNLPFSVSEGKRFVFLLQGQDQVVLFNKRHAETCVGCGSAGLSGSNALGAKTYYNISNEQIETLLNAKIMGFKLYTDDGSHEVSIRPKKDKELKESLIQIQR